MELEDVVVHYKPSSSDIVTLIDYTERALAVFPCRVLPIFRPWYPSDGISQPIRPLNAPPVISKKYLDGTQALIRSANLRKESSSRELVELTSSAQRHGKSGLLLHKKKVSRSWCVTKRKSILSWNSQPQSKQFGKVVCSNKLHLRQRVKWLLFEQNCATAGGLEEVWHVLNLAIKNSKLPTCNANIQRDSGQIWVFCDVAHCEYVGKYLKEKFQLNGNITLFVYKLGNIFSL